jgi:hypothetical protein
MCFETLRSSIDEVAATAESSADPQLPPYTMKGKKFLAMVG